MLIYDMMHKG